MSETLKIPMMLWGTKNQSGFTQGQCLLCKIALTPPAQVYSLTSLHLPIPCQMLAPPGRLPGFPCPPLNLSQLSNGMEKNACLSLLPAKISPVMGTHKFSLFSKGRKIGRQHPAQSAVSERML